MIREGALSWGNCCAATGMPTDDVMLFDVQCEHSYQKGGGLNKAGFALLVFSLFACLPVAIFLWLFAWDFLTTPVHKVGRDTTLTVPLRVRKESQEEVTQISQSRLKKLFCTVPIYEQLLTEYPGASIRAQ
jgi:hypothetical protein